MFQFLVLRILAAKTHLMSFLPFLVNSNQISAAFLHGSLPRLPSRPRGVEQWRASAAAFCRGPTLLRQRNAWYFPLLPVVRFQKYFHLSHVLQHLPKPFLCAIAVLST